MDKKKVMEKTGLTEEDINALSVADFEKLIQDNDVNVKKKDLKADFGITFLAIVLVFVLYVVSLINLSYWYLLFQFILMILSIINITQLVLIIIKRYN